MTSSFFMKLSMTVCWSPRLRPSSSVCCASALRSKPTANSHCPSAIGADYSLSLFSFISFQCRTWMNGNVLCRLEFHVKKEGWGGGGTRMVVFQRGQTEAAVIKPAGKTLTVSVGDGLPKTSSTWDGWMDEVSTVKNSSLSFHFCFSPEPTRKGMPQSGGGGRSQPRNRGIKTPNFCNKLKFCTVTAVLNHVEICIFSSCCSYNPCYMHLYAKWIQMF